jgi:anaerobic ribonucleoside-triphosphate reductase activating protein
MKKLKYVDTAITFSEVPDEISLCINISGCPFRCNGCHSSYLQKDTGVPLTTEEIDRLVSENNGISCVSFMGGDSNPYELMRLIHHVKFTYPELKTCWYSGGDQTYHSLYIEGISHALLDYVKYGCYDLEQGPLDNPNTNQRFYKITWDQGMAHMECMNWWFQEKNKSKAVS